MTDRESKSAPVSSPVVKVLAVTPQADRLDHLRAALRQAGEAQANLLAASAAEALEAVATDAFDLVIVDDAPPAEDALRLVTALRSQTVLALTDSDDWKRVMELLKAGATDTLTPSQLGGGMLPFVLARALDPARRGTPSAEAELRKHRRAEAALRERNKRFRLALKDSPVSVWFQDRELRYTWIFNPGPPFTELRAVIGHTDEEIFGAEVARPLLALKRGVLVSGVRASEEVSFPSGGLETRVNLSVEAARDEAGAITGIVCAAVNVTGVRRTELELHEAYNELTEAQRRLDADMRQRQNIINVLRKQAELLDLAPDAILVCDDDDRILYWSRGAESVYGWKGNEAVGMIASELLLTRFPAPFAEFKTTLLREGTGITELEQTTRDGQSIVVGSRWVARRKDGEPVTFLQINRDITERKQMEAALRESEAHFRAIFSEAAIGIILEDTQGHIIDANPAIQRMLGRDLEEMRELGVGGITHPDDSRSSLKLLAEIELGVRGRQSMTKRYLHKNGATVWGSVTLFGIRDLRGRLRYVTAMIEDVTLRKTAEERLRDAAEQRRLALEAASMGTWDYDLRTVEVSWDERCRALFGVTGADKLRYEELLALIHDEDRAAVDAALRDATRVGSDGRYDLEFRAVWPEDGSVHWLAAMGQTYFEGSGSQWQAVRLVGTLMDVSARKQAEEQIRSHNEHLAEAVTERTAQIERLERQRQEGEKQVAVGRMAARLAHEINNPLAGIGMSFKLLKPSIPEDHPHFDYAERIEKELERIARIVRQMFELYRPEKQDADLFSPAAALHDVVLLLEGNRRAQGVEIVLDAARAEQLVRLHRDSLKQVLFNLLQNAIEASPAGGTVRARADVTDQTLRLTIADDGAGVPAEARDHLFEPFFTTKDYLATGGLGLGLSITRSVVEALGGAIDFTSDEHGTAFQVTIPLAG